MSVKGPVGESPDIKTRFAERVAPGPPVETVRDRQGRRECCAVNVQNRTHRLVAALLRRKMAQKRSRPILGPGVQKCSSRESSLRYQDATWNSTLSNPNPRSQPESVHMSLRDRKVPF
jgi:hypothetical protein